ncbi:cell division protein FtsQ [Microbacterium resistens]|uniref:Cell division protein FtsQ n=1 Tax=Microbacterium resistens TaxID=156977 RepID=A0ABU1SDY1_9MICO|nr:FtsQ-type POTRA domain-containing protein [Microbacterium resistens]MDR6867810.1 cell division protein FtsQ [Microbacterium resistens]
MRRPSPIPRSPEPVEPEVVLRPPSPARASVSPATAEDEQETAPIAPLSATATRAPGGARVAPSSQGSGSGAHSGAGSGSGSGLGSRAGTTAGGEWPEDDRPLGARDVWRAAKARRRTLRAEIRRFTQRSRRRRIAWTLGIAAALLIVLGSAAAAYSPLFAVEKVTVVGTASLDPAAVEKALSGQVGTPLALVDSSEVKAALMAFPLIETYQLEAKPPHDLTVRIVERTPVGAISSDAGFTVVDAAGVALSTTSTRPAGYALLDVKGGLGSAAFTAAGTVMRALPADLRAQVDKVSATSTDDVTLTLASGTSVVWGSAEKSARKALALATLMNALPGKDTYDVSTPDALTAG